MRVDLAGFAREGTLGDHKALMRLVEGADALGFGGIWFNEFHFARKTLPYPSTLMLGADILARTERLRFGTSILVLPLYHPLLLAEQIAQLDFQSGGRVDVGIGRGTEPSTFNALEIARDEAHLRFSEALRIMIEAWTKPHCSADSGPWTFSNVAVGPPPVQKPHPPIYVAGVSEGTVDIAARNGFPLLLSLEPNEARQLPVLHAALKRHGASRATLETSSLSRYVVVAPTRAEANDRVDTLLEKLNARRTERAASRGLKPPEPRSRAVMLADFTIAGTPEDCHAQLCALSARTGSQSIRCLFSANGLINNDVALQGMELFAKEVLPYLGGQSPSTPHSDNAAYEPAFQGVSS
ncbi:LLM class flavin-dependent oxidoreductase [Nitratireductor kimnyeongensis]|uniref:LLM class flavin-dependent oxidoreductase n=1 Tax=Nitratireductor kimnyeongensis TaxID=430679 RepID=A0ABW0T939_9HYPH|nr:LLM class flavin-dependent oxidoreductase [Nitratireductor kimnyeongensis]QZZ34069.1 LLM class flavin-dependent oxidoreductase [Nitratireductor kimnyeongensis]